MTARRCPIAACKGRLRKKKPRDPQDPIWKCVKCGREYMKNRRRWVAVEGLL